MGASDHQKQNSIPASHENTPLIHIPGSLRDAAQELRFAFASDLTGVPKSKFIRIWACVAYLFPSLHPDGYDADESGWPRALRRFADEAWRRAESGEITESEIYQSDAQWCGIYDRLRIRKADETSRRIELAGL